MSSRHLRCGLGIVLVASCGTATLAQPPVAAQPAPAVQSPGQALYSQHCSACHGDKGNGQGLAAAYLYPKPRDFRSGKIRLQSTDNNVASREDLDAVLIRGMAGSSMPSWAHLSPQDRSLLIDEVFRFRGEGARERYILNLKEQQ